MEGIAGGSGGSWDQLHYLDVLKEVYSSLSLPGAIHTIDEAGR